MKTPADAQSAPAVDFPGLVVTFAKSPADTSWSDWFSDFVIRGNNSDSDERSGMLELLDANLRPIATLSFEHISIRRLATTPPESAPVPGVESYTAEMYVEKIRIRVENP